MREEFDQRPLHLGTLLGVRAFRVGEKNPAIARKAPTQEDVVPDPVEHRVANQDCTCGYYAYYDIEREHSRGYDPFSESSCIRAIIEGYGLVTVGTRGFRAQKARLVALIGQRSEEPLARLVVDDGVERVEMEQGIPAELEAYYNVPVYPTVEAAVSEYPLVAPEEPEKESFDG
jgi:hypothetical protein